MISDIINSTFDFFKLDVFEEAALNKYAFGYTLSKREKNILLFAYEFKLKPQDMLYRILKNRKGK